MARVVLAYSGDLATTVAAPWLVEKRRAEVVAVTLDLGQGAELEDLRERALSSGAVRAHVLDLSAEFVETCVLPALQAGATGGPHGLTAQALALPLLSRHLVNVAAIEGATLVAHGGVGATARSLERAIKAGNPALQVLSPAEDWTFTPAEAVQWLAARGIPAPPSAPGTVEAGRNLWGRWIELDSSPAVVTEPSEDLFLLTRPAHDTPDVAAVVEVAFAGGVPIAINGIEMPLVELVASLETIAGAHGVGRFDRVAAVAGGGLRHEIHEAPAAVVLTEAHGALQEVTAPPELTRLGAQMADEYVRLVERGEWTSPARQAIDRFLSTVQAGVTGAVKVRLFKGSCRVVSRDARAGREAPVSR